MCILEEINPEQSTSLGNFKVRMTNRRFYKVLERQREKQKEREREYVNM